MNRGVVLDDDVAFPPSWLCFIKLVSQLGEVDRVGLCGVAALDEAVEDFSFHRNRGDQGDVGESLLVTLATLFADLLPAIIEIACLVHAAFINRDYLIALLQEHHQLPCEDLPLLYVGGGVDVALDAPGPLPPVSKCLQCLMDLKLRCSEISDSL